MKVKKTRDYYTINEELYNMFIEHIESNNLNKSKLIESMIQEYMVNYSREC
jgi:hypothetical protein